MDLGIDGKARSSPPPRGPVVAFLCSASAGFISGTALQVDGAGTLGLL